MTNKSRLIGSFAVVAAVVMYAMTTTDVAARGGGHAGGGGHRGGGEHRQPHPYHPSKHHEEHHAQHHDEHHGEHLAHHNHHHENWHHGDWGPGFWGGAAAGYGLGYAGWGGWGYNGGDTYVDNSTTVNPVSNEDEGDDSSSENSADNTAENSPQTINNQFAAAGPNGNDNFPVDDWPEMGVVTYAGEYGASQGQVVVRVVPNSAASKAGFVPGDVILSLNGQPTPSADALDAVLDAAKVQFEAQVWDARTGRTSTISGPLDKNAPVREPATRDTAASSVTPIEN